MTTARIIVLALVGGAAAAAAGAWVWKQSFSGWARPEVVQASPSGVLHPVTLRPGPDTPRVRTQATALDGRPVDAACSTCHTTRVPNAQARSAADLQEFHQGMAYAHGQQTCLSCHNASDYDTLRRADGSPVAYPRTIELCAQCHGPQYRDYQHGSHGGMTGHWDLKSGPRERNTCTDCHDPHAPAFPKVMPVFSPEDRGARQQRDRTVHPSQSHE